MRKEASSISEGQVTQMLSQAWVLPRSVSFVFVEASGIIT